MQIQKSQKWKLCINILFFVVFFPYFCTLIFHGLTPAYQVVESRDTIKIKVEQEIGVETVSLSDYLIGVLAANIPIEYEDEALKAQTIILRSKILNKYLEKNQYNTALNASDIGCTYYDFNTMQKLWKTEFGENYHRLQKIVAETDNIIITYEGEPIDAPFFLLSSGKTRDTVEAQLEDLYPYIMAVNCPYDAIAENCVQEKRIAASEMSKLLEMDVTTIEVTQMDEAGYVVELQINNEIYNPEDFRHRCKIVSSNFRIKKDNNYFVITSYGQGHGLGFSQNTANELAKEEKTFQEIITYFFQNVEIKKQ